MTFDEFLKHLKIEVERLKEESESAEKFYNQITLMEMGNSRDKEQTYYKKVEAHKEALKGDLFSKKNMLESWFDHGCDPSFRADLVDLYLNNYKEMPGVKDRIPNSFTYRELKVVKEINNAEKERNQIKCNKN